jgi:signal transduction histidine kinase
VKSQVGGSPGVATDRTFKRVARVLAGVSAALAACVLVAWFADPDLFAMLDPHGATMKANSAVCFLALSASFWTRRRAVVGALTTFVGAVGIASLVEYAFDVGLGIDQLLVHDGASGALSAAGRMAPATAGSLVILAAARWALQVERHRLAQVLSAMSLGLGSLALLGYLFQVEQFYTVVRYSTVALPTALTIVLLSLGLEFSVPRGVVHWLSVDRGAGATLVRHMLPVAVIVVPLLAVLPILGVETDLYGARFGIALLVACAAVVLLGATAVAAARLDRIDRERLTAQAELRTLNDQLRERRDLEWRRAEGLSRSLGEERARFQRAIGKIDDLIWTLEVMPDGELRPEFSSGDGSGLFGGGGPAEPGRLARVLPELVHPEDRPLLDAFDAQVRAGEPAEAELRIVGYDGVVRWVWLRGTPRRERAQLFFDGISTNVTERRQLAERRERLLELEQEQVRKLKQLNQMREELLATTGHELRTPLAVVLGYSELLLQDTDLTEVQRKHLGVVANRARQIGLLIEDIFDLAKFSAGLASIDVRPVALHDALAHAVEDHRPAATASEITIGLDVAPVTVAADPARLRQILDNLLSNAIKYSLPGGHVAVTARCDDGTATISVSDGGIGIPEGELEHVFDRMFRASSAKDHDIAGTGLGLAVTKALVEAHDGTISVVNRPQGGTSFTVAIPVQRPAPVPVTTHVHV